MKNKLILFVREKLTGFWPVWGKKALFGLMDQGIFSGMNFLIVILLARWTSPEDYGGFSVIYSLFMLISGLQVSMFAEPMSIAGASRYPKKIGSYLSLLFWIQTILSIVIGILLLIFTPFIHQVAVRSAQFGLAFTMPFIFGYWFFRRAFYLQGQSNLAFRSSIVYSFTLLSLVTFFYFSHSLNPFLVYVAMGVASLLSILASYRSLNVRIIPSAAILVSLNPRQIIRESWNYGKWMLLAYTATWITSMAYPIIISFLINVVQAGTYKAIQNIFLPLQQILATGTLFMMPAMARRFIIQGTASLRKLTLQVSAVTAVFSLIYSIVVISLGTSILVILYKTSFYTQSNRLITSFAISSFISALTLTFGISLRVLELPKMIVWARAGSVAATLIAGAVLIPSLKMEGIVWCLMVSAVVDSLLTAIFYMNAIKDRTTPY